MSQNDSNHFALWPDCDLNTYNRTQCQTPPQCRPDLPGPGLLGQWDWMYWYWYLSNLGQNSLYSILIDTKYPKVQHWNCHFFDFQNQNKNEQNDTISGKVWALKFKKYLTWTNFWIVHYNLSKIKFLFH